MADEQWEVITSLVHCFMCNTDGVEWGLSFFRYADETRKATCGGEIGYLDKDGLIVVTNPRKHRIIFAKPSYKGSSLAGKGIMIWLENKKYEEK